MSGVRPRPLVEAQTESLVEAQTESSTRDPAELLSC